MTQLGYHAFETFGGVIEEWETKAWWIRTGGSEKYGVPIVSALCATDVLDPAKTKDEREKIVRWTKLLKGLTAEN
jgi:inosose dehydratase